MVDWFGSLAWEIRTNITLRLNDYVVYPAPTQPLKYSSSMSIDGTYGDPNLMFKLAKYRMPFGKHSNTLLIDLPLAYLDWFLKKGFPQGELGRLMRIVHETKSDGMEDLFEHIRKKLC